VNEFVKIVENGVEGIVGICFSLIIGAFTVRFVWDMFFGSEGD
jgi:hypothetical protein